MPQSSCGCVSLLGLPCGTSLDNPILSSVPSLHRETGIPLAASSARGSWKSRGGLFWNSWMKINEKILDTKNVYRWQNKTKPCVGKALGPVAGGPWPQQRWLLVFYHFSPVKSRKIHGILRAKLCLAWSCGAGWGLGSPGGDTEVAAVSPSTFPVSFPGQGTTLGCLGRAQFSFRKKTPNLILCAFVL